MSEQAAPLYTDRAGFLAKVAEVRTQALDCATATPQNVSEPVSNAVDHVVKGVLELLDQPNVTLIVFPDESKGDLADPVQINNGDDSLVTALFGSINS